LGVDVHLVAIADPQRHMADDAHRRYGFARSEENWKAIAANPDIDLVSVAVPDAFHREIVEGMAAAGKHVLCEKPLAAAVEDAEAMVDAVERAGVIGAVSHEWRRIPAVSNIRWHINNGALGDLLHFHGRFFADYGLIAENRLSWRFSGPPGSGVVSDVGSHLIDLAEYLCGPLARIHGALLTGVDAAAAKNEDMAFFSCSFRSGTIGSFALSRMAKGQPIGLGFDVYGTAGAASFDLSRPAEFYLLSAAAPLGASGTRILVGLSDPSVHGGAPSGGGAGLGHGLSDYFVIQARAFLEQVVGRSGLTPCVSFREELRTVQAMDAVVRSAGGGGKSIGFADVAGPARAGDD
jgi:predicted dehydrogenase